MTNAEYNAEALDGFGERLTKARLKRKQTRAEFADTCGLHYDAILKLERGDRKPTLGTMRTIADALGVKLTALLPRR